MEGYVSPCSEKFDPLGLLVVGLLSVPCCSTISGLIEAFLSNIYIYIYIIIIIIIIITIVVVID